MPSACCGLPAYTAESSATLVPTARLPLTARSVRVTVCPSLPTTPSTIAWPPFHSSPYMPGRRLSVDRDNTTWPGRNPFTVASASRGE